MADGHAKHEKIPLAWLSVFLGLGVFSISISPILIRYASEAPGFAVAALRNVFATILLAPFAWVKIRHEVLAFSRKDYLLIGGAGVVLGLHFITWIESLYHTSVASGSVLVAITPIFLGILGFLFLRERLNILMVLSICVAVSGAILISIGTGSENVAVAEPNALFGNSLALTAALFYSIYLLIGRVVRQGTSWLGYVFPLYFVVSITTVIFALSQGVSLLGYDWTVYALCGAMAVGPSIIGHGSFNFAVKYLRAAILGVLGLLEPVIASLFAYFLFGEKPAVLAMMGMSLVLGSVVWAVLLEREKQRQGEEDVPTEDTPS